MTVLNKLKILLTLIMGLLLLAPGVASAYTETLADTTLVLPYRGTSPSTYPGYTTWMDVIGSTPSQWDVKQLTVNWTGTNLEMQIFTNYAQAGLEGAGQADIALDPSQTGSWNVGIKMSGANKGKIYSVTSWIHPQSDPPLSWDNGSWIYGGRYDQADPKIPNTLIGTSTDVLGTAQVDWVTLPLGSLTKYMIDVVFPDGFNASGDWNSFNFEVGSGSCGNEVMAGTANFSPGDQVPIPASVLLLGTGLVGLVGLKWRRKEQS